MFSIQKTLWRGMTIFALVFMTVSSASAGAVSVSPLTLVSGPSPFAGCTIGGSSDDSGVNYVNSEVEPWVAVNPTKPKNIVGVFQQDRWSDGGAHGLVTAVSHNGGKTCNRTWAHFSFCSSGTAANGGGYERTSDPWVFFAPTGEAYQIAISFNASDATNSVLVSKSSDGGDTWSEPTTLIVDTSPFNFMTRSL